MSLFWRTSAITGAALFLEAAAAYLAISLFTTLTNMAGARLPLWLTFLALTWAFLLSWYVQTIRFSLNLRGIFGLSVSLISILVLANLNTNMGFFPVGRILNGDILTAFSLILTLAFLVALWWRGSNLAHDEVTLETVKGAFQWGLAVVVGAVIIDSLVDAENCERIPDSGILCGGSSGPVPGSFHCRIRRASSDVPGLVHSDWRSGWSGAVAGSDNQRSGNGRAG